MGRQDRTNSSTRDWGWTAIHRSESVTITQLEPFNHVSAYGCIVCACCNSTPVASITNIGSPLPDANQGCECRCDTRRNAISPTCRLTETGTKQDGCLFSMGPTMCVFPKSIHSILSLIVNSCCRERDAVHVWWQCRNATWSNL